MKSKRFPIVDVQFHREGLSDISDEHEEHERTLLSLWHSTAIERLVCGAHCGLSYPAAFDESRQLRPIEDELILVRDSHGRPSFKHVFKVES